MSIPRKLVGRATKEEELFDPNYVIDNRLTCPNCKATRGGNYPLVLVESAEGVQGKLLE